MKNINFVLTLIILVFIITSCNIGQTEEQITLFDQYYAIDPSSLIDSIKNGDTGAFTPVSDEPELLPVDQQTPVNWLQADYFYIANALGDSILGKRLESWQLNSMSFSTSCNYIHNGFQNGRFEFFKVIKEKEKDTALPIL